MRSRQQQNERFNLMKMLLNCLRQCSKHFSVPCPSATEDGKTHDPKNPAAKQGRTSIHGLRPCMNCALRGPALTCESQGRLRRSAPYKGLHPLRRFAAIPAPSPERYTRFASAPSQRGQNRILSPLTVYPTQQVDGLLFCQEGGQTP